MIRLSENIYTLIQIYKNLREAIYIKGKRKKKWFLFFQGFFFIYSLSLDAMQ